MPNVLPGLEIGPAKTRERELLILIEKNRRTANSYTGSGSL